MFSIPSIFSKTISTRLIICLLFFFVFNPVFPQQKNTLIEDDYEILKDKVRFYFNMSHGRAMMYAEQMTKSSNCEHLAFANGVMTVFFQTKGNAKESQKRYKTALYYLGKIPESHDKTQLKSYIYNYGAIAEASRGNYSKAFENYQTALKFAIRIDDIKQIIKIKGNIAALNDRIGNHQLAIKYRQDLFLTRGLYVLYVFLSIGIISILIKNKKDKEYAHKSMIALTEKSKMKKTKLIETEDKFL